MKILTLVFIASTGSYMIAMARSEFRQEPIMGIKISSDAFGTVTNPKTKKLDAVIRYTLRSSQMIVKVVSYGATVTSIETPDKTGQLDDVVLGFDNIQGYQSSINPYFGATVGRCANRIAGGTFQLNGTTYQLPKNAGSSHLHGGIIGFDKVNWNACLCDDKVIFTYLSTDGEEGYPGDLLATVAYQLIDNRLIITYEAMTTKTTIVNLTNHSYFNLAGHGTQSEGLYKHNISINADAITVLDKNMTATGEIKSIDGTNYDLRTQKNLGKAIESLAERGFDFNYCLNKPGSLDNTVIFAARVCEPESGRTLEVHTDQPGVQFYTGNFIPEGTGKNETKFGKHSGFSLETQNYPNSINISSFPTPVLKPGERYTHTVWYTFGVAQESC